MKVKNKL